MQDRIQSKNSQHHDTLLVSTACFVYCLTCLTLPQFVCGEDLEAPANPVRRPIQAKRPDLVAKDVVEAPGIILGGVTPRIIVTAEAEELLVDPELVASRDVNADTNPELHLFADNSERIDDQAPGDDDAILKLLGLPKRAWGPEQATGEPDTPQAGDIKTAWASQTPDEQTEWLLVEYAEPIDAKQLLVHETYNPGALFKVSVFDPEGKETTVWQGVDPTLAGSGLGVSKIPIQVDFKFHRARLHLDSTLIGGFNEIDAVGLVDTEDQTHWAVAAKASSTYAPSVVTIPIHIRAIDIEKLRAIDREVKQLRKEAEKVRQLEAEIQELREAVRKLAEEKPATGEQTP